jgi:hypothetical protein
MDEVLHRVTRQKHGRLRGLGNGQHRTLDCDRDRVRGITGSVDGDLGLVVDHIPVLMTVGDHPIKPDFLAAGLERHHRVDLVHVSGLGSPTRLVFDIRVEPLDGGQVPSGGSGDVPYFRDIRRLPVSSRQGDGALHRGIVPIVRKFRHDIVVGVGFVPDEEELHGTHRRNRVSRGTVEVKNVGLVCREGIGGRSGPT